MSSREANALIVTRGEQGSSVFTARGGRIDVPAVAPRRVVDPTGVGDAFRGGLMKGMALGVPYETAARIGSVAATYALEHLGGQSHSYTWREFAGSVRRTFRSAHCCAVMQNAKMQRMQECRNERMRHFSICALVHSCISAFSPSL